MDVDYVKEKNSEFDFDKFFFDSEEEYFEAIKIITPRQTITCFADLHELEAERIMNAIYDEYAFSFGKDDYWVEKVNSMGCIAIQMLRRNFEIINIPTDINEYQFNELFRFYQDMMNVNRALTKIGEEPIELHTNFCFNGEFLTLGKALLKLKHYIKNDLPMYDELIIDSDEKKKH